MAIFEQNSVVNDYMLKHKKLVCEFSITANATPASKKHNSPDLPGVLLLRTEGKIAEVDAIEVVAYTTAADNSTGDSVFGVMIRGGSEGVGLGSIAKILKITVSEKTSLATSLAVTKHGTNGLSTAGNIAFSIAGTGLTLATESPTIVVEIDYVASK